ncbi:MAG TPA: hypothetical protein PLQ57_07010 [Saprospiraceae bacterium]|nr:hypothetical protein [Saprospiraceae bacterium]HRG65687.1 hypothetical protein [Saprospiraceae bacterium]
MITFEFVQKDMLERLGLQEQPHFEKTSFRKNKKIFLTYNAAEDLICVKLKPEDQQSFELVAKGVIFAVPNKWGQQGWTLARLNQLEKDLYDDLIQTALAHFK